MCRCFWKHCQNDTDVSGIGAVLEFYEENGPTGFCRYRLPDTRNDFGVEGYLVMLVGNRAPYRLKYTPTDLERAIWQRHRADFIATAQNALDVKDSLAFVRHPGWTWHGDGVAN